MVNRCEGTGEVEKAEFSRTFWVFEDAMIDTKRIGFAHHGESHVFVHVQFWHACWLVRPDRLYFGQDAVSRL
jgi:hypothetical protein